MTKELMQIIEKIGNTNSAPTTMKIGYTVNNICKDNGIVIQDASSAIVKAVMNEANKISVNGTLVLTEMNLENNGLLVRVVK